MYIFSNNAYEVLVLVMVDMKKIIVFSYQER